MVETEVHSTKPKNFSPKIEVSAAYVEIKNEILFLQRAGSEKGLWGVPAGKLETGESAEAALKRELLEETGISINSHSHIAPLGQLFICKPSGDYIYHLYGVYLSKKPAVTLSSEHQDSCWITHDEIETFPLMSGALEAFLHFKKVSCLRKG